MQLPKVTKPARGGAGQVSEPVCFRACVLHYCAALKETTKAQVQQRSRLMEVYKLIFAIWPGV